MNIVYFTMGNKKYVKLAKLCINSILKTGYKGDFLFITDERTEIENSLNIDNKIHFMETEETNLMASSANKLKIHKWEHAQEYDKFIFTDLDILWFINPDIIFDKIKENKIYFSQHENQGSITEVDYGGNLLDKKEKEIYKDTQGVNAGFFCFNKDQLAHFDAMEKYLNDNFDKRNACLEQPYINVYCTKHNLIDVSLNEFVSHESNKEMYQLRDNYIAKELGFKLIVHRIKPIIHFPGGPGSADYKYGRMINFLSKAGHG